MAARPLIVFVPSEGGVFDRDALGSIVTRFGDAEISIVAAGSYAPPEGHGNVRMRTLDELRGLDVTDSVVLLLGDRGTPAAEMRGCEGIAELERRLLLERAVVLMRRGVRLRDPRAVYIRGELACGAGVEIDVNVIVEGRVALGAGVTIGANSVLRNATVGERSRVHPFSTIEDSQVGCDSFVGPYGRIRPGSSIGDEVQIGNYVEIKNARIGARSRINHHSFIGDAVLGERVTIGAGTITCNHDGARTHQTTIERDAYIGSGCRLIAPLRVGEGATVGAGSTLSRDVPAGKLTLARARQSTIEGWPGPRAGRDGK